MRQQFLLCFSLSFFLQFHLFSHPVLPFLNFLFKSYFLNCLLSFSYASSHFFLWHIEGLLRASVCDPDSDLFQTANAFLPVAVSLAQYNTQIQISHKIAPLKTNKQYKEKQISSQSYTNSEGHITAKKYSVEKRKRNKANPDTGF
jgi:hypothetical protein